MKICKNCSEPFSTSPVINGRRVVLSSRSFCLTCSPFKGGNRKDLTKPKEPAQKRKHSYAKVKNYRKRVKQALVDYKGGKCCLCGYSKCLSALVFHHVTPADKNFSIAVNSNRSLTLLKEEADKCILVCNRCHSEIHEGITEIPVALP